MHHSTSTSSTSSGRCCTCYYVLKAFMKTEVECAPPVMWVYVVLGLLFLLPIIPAMYTHYSPMFMAYCWMFLPSLLVVFMIFTCIIRLEQSQESHKGQPTSWARVKALLLSMFIRCLCVFMALFTVQAPIEIGCFLYGYSLNSMPADGGEYLGAISHWWHTRDTTDYFDCLVDRTSDQAGAIFDVLSWF